MVCNFIMFGPLVNMKPLSLDANAVHGTSKKSFSTLKSGFLWDILGIYESRPLIHRAKAGSDSFVFIQVFFF